MSKPGKQHREVVKWIFNYPRGTTDYGLVFGRGKGDSLVVGYVDSDYISDLDDRRSTIGYIDLYFWRRIYLLEVYSSIYCFIVRKGDEIYGYCGGC